MLQVTQNQVKGLAMHRVKILSAFRGRTRPVRGSRGLTPNRFLETRASAGEGHPGQFGLAPSQPRTPYGEYMLAMLSMEPQLFRSAIEDRLSALKEEKDAKKKMQPEAGTSEESSQDSGEVVLYKRMEELKAAEVAATVEDLMYLCILEKFVLLEVEMLPRMDGYVDPTPQNLRALTEGIHSKEALELVREHLISIMGPGTMNQYSNTMLKMSKFQMVQVYAASIMFGYFLRRVDQRFQLDRSFGTLMMPQEDTAARLERLFQEAEASDYPEEEGASPTVSQDGFPDVSSSSSSSTSSASKDSVPARKEKSALRKYVESFDQAAMVETARIVSSEGAALVERQTTALLGDIKKLQSQIQETVGSDASSMKEVMERMAKAVQEDKVETLTMTIATQRRAVLEAVAYGTFLRDVESWVNTDYGLLNPLPPPRQLPGAGASDSDKPGPFGAGPM